MRTAFKFSVVLKSELLAVYESVGRLYEALYSVLVDEMGGVSGSSIFWEMYENEHLPCGAKLFSTKALILNVECYITAKWTFW